MVSLTIPSEFQHLRIAVCCVIRQDDKILLVSRKDNPNSFGLPGGKVDPGETPQEAVIREVKEETGLDIVLGPAIFAEMCPRHAPEGEDFYAFAFVAKAFDGSLATHESGVLKWGTWADQKDGQFAAYNQGVRTALAVYDES